MYGRIELYASFICNLPIGLRERLTKYLLTDAIVFALIGCSLCPFFKSALIFCGCLVFMSSFIEEYCDLKIEAISFGCVC